MSYDLCEELIVEIFTRLPAASLVRFRSVSKSLCKLIGSPDFIRLHTLRSAKKVMIVQQACGTGLYIDYMYTFHSRGQLSCDPYIDVRAAKYPFKKFSIVGSCNGIICLHEYGNGINLWNPSIRRKVTVHDRPSLSDCDGERIPLGFGFDPVMNDYKILVTVGASTCVYTMKTDTWREIASPVIPCGYKASSQCLFNGALHWAIQMYINGLGGDCLYCLLTFDLSSEVFSTTELPEPSWETNQVAIISGSLAVISSKHDDCWIWVRNLNTITASWSVAFKVSTHEFEVAQSVFQRTANDDLLFNPFLSGVNVLNPRTGTQSRFVANWRVRNMTPCDDSLGLLDVGGTSCDLGTRKFSFYQNT